MMFQDIFCFGKNYTLLKHKSIFNMDDKLL
jgi:hypothetical protein